MNNHSPSLADLLNYAHFIDDGIIINKDGAFVQAFQFRGPDIHSATHAELDALANHFNRFLTFLDDGWMLHVDTIRVPCLTYPPCGAFPNSVAKLIDDERRQSYQAIGEHYENLQFLTLVWKFPLSLVHKTKHWFVQNLEDESKQPSLTALLNQFKDMVERCIGIIRNELTLSKLTSSELLSYLNTCLTGELLPISLPPDGCYLDVILGRKPLIGGYIPRIDNKYIHALTITGYLNTATTPGLIDEMSAYPLQYRWSNRFIPLGERTAEREMRRHQKNWNNKVKGFSGIIKEAISGKSSNKINIDALQMSEEITQAITINSNQSVRFGYWTSVIVMIHAELPILNQAGRALREYLEQNGFSCHLEELNGLEAWLGTIPGHGSSNSRRLFLHSLNLAHILPLHSIWAGEYFSPKTSLLPANSPPVFYAATTGKTPFRFHLDVDDIGHQIILGPTGSGKSTYLDFLIAQFLRYDAAQIFIFDKDCSHRALTLALNGHHYNLCESSPIFCPLTDLDSDSAILRAVHFIENLVLLQCGQLTPLMRNAIHNGVLILADPAHQANRNLTVLRSQIQNAEVRAALQYYTIDGPMKLLDSTEDSLQTSYLQTFEMNWLLTQKPDVYLPVLFYIFDRIDARLTTVADHSLRPTLIILEEAWLYLSQPLFANKLKDWLKTLRKKNARVIFATQSLTDLYNPSQKTLSDVSAVVLESCPTKVYLPNPHVESEIKSIYEKIGLNSRQIEIISEIAMPKHHYYVVTPNGNRLIDLGFSETRSLALAFIGLSLTKSLKLIDYKAKHGEQWVYFWLNDQGFPEWANYWREHYFIDQEALCATCK